ncbi:terminase small subunit-like protein [Orrella dioscoreae]|uniref:Phage terminase, small subunit n=1 Tax=Orrella dioscoreae TaxID=1851544 RepID=A0A1C3K1M4_9BURK|nr:hypothetical protein [Orrella dioscoreae]SBT25324.1 Phage terminase, small subunit [Orrella dioscoreae]SOE49113.1 Phage terminase, small subunit [Orrella dioscoreae]
MTKTEKPAKAPRGRASTYREEVADQIVWRLAEGETLRDICRSEGMPAWRTVYDWLDAHPEFAARFARARDLGCDAIAEQTLEILDEKPERTLTEQGDKIDPGFVQWQKNRAEQRLKLLAKWHPKKYGDKQQIEHSGSLSIADALREAKLRRQQGEGTDAG